MATPLGVGIACTNSVGPRFTLATGNQCLGQSLYRRLITDRGSMPWAPNDGTDIRNYLNAASTATGRFAIERAVKDECEKDERVQSASVSASVNVATNTCTLTVTIVTSSGSFDLVLLVDNLTISILAVT